MENKDKIILDFCGGTGAWSKPYKDAGYDVKLITLPDFDVTHTFPFNGMVTGSLKQDSALGSLHFDGDENLNVQIKDVYGILAAPPCTHFSRARTTSSRDFHEGMKTVISCLEIIWACQKNTKLQFWALENPMGLLRRFLGRPELSFQPWWYGDLHSKQTDLWGWFNEPKRRVFDIPLLVERGKHNSNTKYYASPVCPPEYKDLKLSRSDLRAITPPCFAKAFFEANP